MHKSENPGTTYQAGFSIFKIAGNVAGKCGEREIGPKCKVFFLNEQISFLKVLLLKTEKMPGIQFSHSQIQILWTVFARPCISHVCCFYTLSMAWE